MNTADRILEVALGAFAEQGVSATSLDELAKRLGVTKQTILYHFGSKDRLLAEVVRLGAGALLAELSNAVEESEPGWDRVEETVRAAFALAVRRPELLGLLREVTRLGPPSSDEVIRVLDPLIEQSVRALDRGMDSGLFRRSDPRLVLVSAYAVTTGVVTEAEVLRAVGLELDLRVAARLRQTVLDFLSAALLP
ncbi:MAG: AcrR family transcriptional regulator [Acidimicrobiales bacterium]|jgi:TetR/AcrR family transcriptional regulator